MLKLINIKKFRDKVSALPNLTRLVVPRMISVANNRTLPFDMYVALEEKPIDHGTTNQALDISSVTTTEQKNDKGTGEQQKDQNKIPKKRYHVFIPPGGDLQMAVAFMNSRSAWAIGVKINSCHAGTRTYDVLAKHPFSNKIRRAKEVLLVNIDLARWLEKVSHLDNVTRLELIGCHQLSAAMSELRGLTASKLETFFLEEAPSQKPIIREQDFEIDGLMQLTASMQNLRNLRIHHPYDLVEEGSKLRRPVDFLPLNGNRVENCSIRCGSPRQRTTPIDILEFVSNCTNLRGVAFTWYNLWGYYLHRVESDLYKRDLNALKIFADQSCKVQHILVFLPTKYDDNPVDKSKIGNIHQFVADQIEETIRGSDSSLKSISVTVRGQEIFDSVELPVVVHFRVLSPSGVEQVPESAILERSDLRALGACRERTPMHPIGRVTGFCYESESMTYL
ncbi:hypothetical protein B0J11DRAFT_606115 [Dendryphion nanum]|uniref:Uncharacterized protein n=1 Tax=Dendryphion nanum TaxID=256645 RepID=A0A9P9INJ8_9PLEO|nr:hypothetical protein B0J11DRAFT_606115 [Dendryphion nanum]